MITLVVARADNGVIGRDGKLPWHIPEDLKRFKALTTGTAMAMGRKTFESLPGLLPGRRHIVLTRDPDWRAQGAEVVSGLAEALARSALRTSVIGGAEIYRLFQPVADRIELTEVHAHPPGDTFLEAFDPAHWREIARETRPADGTLPAFSFVTMVRA